MENQACYSSEERFNSLPTKTDSSATTSLDYIFEKYRAGLVSIDAPFQLFQTKNEVSVDDDSSDENDKSRKCRGPYRKYTFEEKLIAVEKVNIRFIQIQKGEDVK